ncbi:MAG TPA: hypothetical protein VGI39_36075 [Polyangiaceae bacterium]|jgi:hypothetical protein
MSLLVTAIAVGTGLLMGGWLGRGKRQPPPPKLPAPGADARGANEKSARAPEREPSAEEEAAIDWGAFPCALGDVVVRTLDHTEAWLAGGVVFCEDAPAGVLFIAPERGGEGAILAWPRPRRELGWLTPVHSAALAVGDDPPSAIELDGVRFERTRRLPLRLERVGTGAPDMGAQGVVGEYRAASGEIALVVVAEGVARGWRGRMLGEGEYEIWGNAKRPG